MRKGLLLLALLCAAPAGADTWLALTLYPGGSVYQVPHLRTLQQVTQSLWEIKDERGEGPLSALDSLATTNAIAIQGDDVRFRRLIEARELTPAGMKRLARLVERHPVLGHRLVTGDGEGTHFWFRLGGNYSRKQQTALLDSYGRRMAQAFGDTCAFASPDEGPLTGLERMEWQWRGDRAGNIVETLEHLAELRPQGRSIFMSWSAADLLAYLRQTLGEEPGLPSTREEVAQLYTVAESLRSRHLQDLARPDFRALRMVVLGRRIPDPPSLPGYELTGSHHWRADSRNYRIVDCR